MDVADEMVARRIHASSAYGTRNAEERELIDKFVARSAAFSRHVREDVARYGMASVTVDEGATPATLAARCRSLRVGG